MYRRSGFSSLYVCLLILASLPSQAQAPRSIPFQGILKTKSGQLINRPSQAVKIELWTVGTGRTLVYTETRTLPITAGILNVNIGEGNPTAFASIPFERPYDVAVSIGTELMTPSLRLAAVPYARMAIDVPNETVSAAKLAWDSESLFRISNKALYTDGTNVGIGIISPSARLEVDGNVRVRGSNFVEFGRGIADRDQESARIYYGPSPAALNIIGGGTSVADRRIYLSANGGIHMGGPTDVGFDLRVRGNQINDRSLTVGSSAYEYNRLHVRGNAGALALEGYDHSFIEFYPRTATNGRKAYIGFPGAWSTDFVIANEDSGVLRVLGTFVNNSDARLKTNVEPLKGALDSILHLQGVSYDWKKDVTPTHKPDRRQIGLMAQDVEKVLPDLVFTSDSGDKGVAYTNIIPVLVEAIKQQQAEIESLKATVAELKQ